MQLSYGETCNTLINLLLYCTEIIVDYIIYITYIKSLL